MHSNECKREDDAHETRPSSSSSANESSDNRALSDNRASMYEQPRQSMISKSSARAGLLCMVCADRASGYHYGVPSCEGCKAFFKRSLQLKQMNYKCPASNNCTIDKMSRKCCQACRLAKCHAVGMSKDYLGNKIKRPRPKDGDGKGKYKRSASNSAKECLESVLTPAEIEYESTIQHLITLRNSEPETLVLESQEAHAKFSDAIGKDLIKIIDWAKEIAGYNQLVLSDQAVLLQNNWMDMLVLDWMTRSISDPQSLMLANNFRLNAQEARALGLEEIFSRTIQLLQRLSCFGLTEEEMCCLKAISLTNPDLTKSPEAVRALNERFTSSLEYFTRNRHRSKPLKFAKLVLALPQVKSIASSLLDLLTEFIKERRPLFSDLLVEMLEAKQRL